MYHAALIPVLAVLLTVGSSHSIACLNDTSVRAAEDEFRSRYESTSANDAPVTSNQLGINDTNLWGIAGLAVGSGLVAGSSVIGFRRRKRQGI